MNKYGIVFGAAAVAVIAGCKDPDYKPTNAAASQNEVKQVEPDAKAQPILIETVATRTCSCAPGTVHEKPCGCGAADCACAVAAKPVVIANLSSPRPAAPAKVEAHEAETTVYIVQRGDYLAKISKKYNITIASIKQLNPSIGEKNIVRVGQKIKLPGKVDVGVQAEPVKVPTKVSAKKPYAPYSGATKEYVVKSGDTLGGIAYSNGINIRQLKELNGLQKDILRVGQKLKIPAEKVSAAKAAPKAHAAAAKKVVAAAKPAEAPLENVQATAASVDAADKTKTLEAVPLSSADASETASAVEPAATEAPAAAPAPAAGFATYVVQEGDDMTGVSIRWGVSAAEIRELNNLGEKDQLVPGQIIKLPADAQQ